MKKLIAMIIALSCILCVFSCDMSSGGTHAPQIPEANGGVSFAEFVSAVAGMSSVKTSVIKTTFISPGKGELNSVFNITYNADGSSVIVYTSQRFGDVEAEEDYIVTDGPFTVECDANGNYTVGGDVYNVIASGAYSLNLDSNKLYDSRIEGNVLYTTVFSTDTQAVLGVAIPATVALSVVINNGKVSSVSADYVKNGNYVKVKCEYGF